MERTDEAELGAFTRPAPLPEAVPPMPEPPAPERRSDTRPSLRRLAAEGVRALGHVLRHPPFWVVVVVALLAAIPRLYGLNWDANNHLHPDERQIVFTAQCLTFPGTIRPGNCAPAYVGPGWLFSPDSPLNPHFFAYGSLPMYLLAAVVHGLARLPIVPPGGGAWDDFDHFTLVGRALSALFDVGTVLLVGVLARLLAGRRAAVLAAALVAVLPFEVQLAHFYAVDTQLHFFAVLTLIACVLLVRAPVRPVASTDLLDWSGWWRGLAVGACLALAVATKVSALPLLAPVVVALALAWRRGGVERAMLATLGAAGAFVLVFALTSPYALLDWAHFQAQVNEQASLSRGDLDYPYVRQFAGTVPYLYHLRQMALYDMGLPAALLAGVGAVWAAVRAWRRPSSPWSVVVVWIVGYFLATGGAYMKFSRYMLPLYGPLAVCAAGATVWLAARLVRHPLVLGRPGWPRVRFGGRSAARVAFGVAGVAVILSALFTTALVGIYSRPNTRVQASEWIYDHVAPGSTLTNEIWDDPLPVGVPAATTSAYGVGYTAAGKPIQPGAYGQVGLDLYAEDTPTKAQTLSKQLASADVVVLSSQRLVRSIAKLPDRYPMTNRYYRLLFDGQLGFRLAEHVEAHPALFGVALDESGADESYSVYDHPPVWIFVRSGPSLSSDRLYDLLTDGVTLPANSTRAGTQKSLLLDDAARAADDASAPLGQQFPATSLPNRIPLIWWLLVVELLGVAAFPLAALAFRGLSDRGWGLSKVLALLVVGYVTWLPASLGVLPFDTWTVLLAAALLAAAGVAVGWWRRAELVAFFRARWRLVLLTEGLFVAGFLVFAWIRALDPDLWHIWRGGEKPMEIAFLDGILRSRTLPPQDPWFAGGTINYYYYGQYLVAVLIRLTGVAPTTAFNLAIPMLFGLTLAGVASIVGGLTRRAWAGVAAALGFAVLGNLDGLLQVIGQWQATLAGQVPPPFDFWRSSRVIPYVIDEFPFWSFLYADLHAHLLDLPIVLLVLGGCASLLLTARQADWRGRAPTLAAIALGLGATYCVNAWDFPTCALFVTLSLLIALFMRSGAGNVLQFVRLLTWRRVRGTLLAIVLTVGGAYTLYYPFQLTFQSFVQGTGPVTVRTDPGQFATVFGLWLFLIGSFFAVEVHDRVARVTASPTFPLAAVFTVVAAYLVAFALGVGPLLMVLLALGMCLALSARRGAAAWFAYLTMLVGLAIALGTEMLYLRDFLDGSSWERMNTVFKFYYQVWQLFALGGGIAFALLIGRLLRLDTPEESPAADGDGGSDALVASKSKPYGVARTVALGGRLAWGVVLLMLFAGSLIFPYLGTAVRVQDPAAWAEVQPPPGGVQPQGLSLDGFAYMRGWYPDDAAAITWLNDNVGGIPTILEASNGGYQWYGRVSIYTGLPSVLGWSSHEYQQRYTPGTAVWARQADVQRFYGTDDAHEAVSILRKYDVRYVYLGDLEQHCYATDANNTCMPIVGPALAKFQTLTADGTLTPVYSSGQTIVYRVK